MSDFDALPGVEEQVVASFFHAFLSALVSHSYFALYPLLSFFLFLVSVTLPSPLRSNSVHFLRGGGRLE